jgi:MFS family permease
MHNIRGIHISSINKLSILGLISSFAIASVVTIWAIYIDMFVKNPSYVGFITAFFTVIGTLSYIFLIPLVEKCDKVKLYELTIIVYLVSYVLFAFLPSIYVIIVLGSILAITGSLKITLFGIIFRDKTKDNEVSKNEGFIYTLMNLAWVIAPIIAGFIANKYGLKEVFLFAAGILLINSFLFRVLAIKDGRKNKKIDKKPLKQFFNYFKNKERVYAYFLGGGVSLWWSLIYIYIPVYLYELGMGEKIVGYFLGAVVLPLIATEYYFGKLAGKKGFKKIFLIGYLILSISAFIVFFIPNIYIILAILIIASLGTGMLESTTESYFFDIITPGQRDKYYGPYNTTIELNAFLGSLIPAIILLFFPFKTIFLFFAGAMLILSLISLRIKNIIESNKKITHKL